MLKIIKKIFGFHTHKYDLRVISKDVKFYECEYCDHKIPFDKDK